MSRRSGCERREKAWEKRAGGGKLSRARLRRASHLRAECIGRRLSHGFAAGLVAVLHGEPLSVAFAVGVGAVALIEDVAQLVDQDVVEVEIAKGLFGPNQPPHA